MAGRILTESLMYEVYAAASDVPYGKVASYGQIASLVGRPKNARLVGKVLSMADRYGDYPCHRIVASDGRLVAGWHEQKTLLEQEGVIFKDEHHVDMKKCRWDYGLDE